MGPSYFYFLLNNTFFLLYSLVYQLHCNILTTTGLVYNTFTSAPGPRFSKLFWHYDIVIVITNDVTT